MYKALTCRAGWSPRGTEETTSYTQFLFLLYYNILVTLNYTKNNVRYKGINYFYLILSYLTACACAQSIPNRETRAWDVRPIWWFPSWVRWIFPGKNYRHGWKHYLHYSVGRRDSKRNVDVYQWLTQNVSLHLMNWLLWILWKILA